MYVTKTILTWVSTTKDRRGIEDAKNMIVSTSGVNSSVGLNRL